MKRVRAGLLALWMSTSSLSAGTLLPNGEQQFIDNNGNPLASGTVTFYVPATTTLKNTWSNSAQTILNTNPIVLDSGGRAIIYGSGAYRQVVKDKNGNVIWDQLTSDTSSASNLGWGSTSSGTANAQTISTGTFTGVDGQTIYFLAGYTNSASMTLNVNGTGPVGVLKDGQGGPIFLTGGEVVAGAVIGVTYSIATGQFHLNTNNNQWSPGQVGTFAMATCPAGWVAANGASYSRTTTYGGLYAAIGTTWGTGDGSTTFNVPDFRGVFLRGTGTNANPTVVAAGGAVGQSLGSIYYAADTYLNHNHTATSTDSGHTHTYGAFGLGNIAGSGSSYTLPNSYPTGNTGTGYAIITTTVATSTTGGTETKPKNYSVLYCIKY
jgi:microcystin-dependent protein